MAHNHLMEEIITKLSLKYNLPKTAMRVILDSPFRVLSEQVKENTLQGVNFNKLGKFAIRADLKKKIQENPEKVKRDHRAFYEKRLKETQEYNEKLKKEQDEIRASNSDF